MFGLFNNHVSNVELYADWAELVISLISFNKFSVPLHYTTLKMEVFFFAFRPPEATMNNK